MIASLLSLSLALAAGAGAPDHRGPAAHPPAAVIAPAPPAAAPTPAPSAAPAPVPSPSPTPAAVQLPPMPFAPGERMDFAVEYLGMTMGRARISVGERQGSVLPVSLDAKSGGVVSMFDIREHLASHLDLESGLPRSTVLEAHEPGGYYHIDTTHYDRDAGRATVREKGKFDNTYLIEVPAGTMDFVGLIFRLRTLPLENGLRHEFKVLAGRKVNTIVAEVIGRETIDTDAGKFAAVKVRVPTGLSGKFTERNPTFVWFSDDARRIVVRISTDFAIGRALAGLSGYQAGRAGE